MADKNKKPKKPKKGIGKANPRNPRGLSKEELEEKKRIGRDIKKYPKRKKAAATERKAQERRKIESDIRDYADQKAEGEDTVDTTPKAVDTGLREVTEPKKPQLTEEQRATIEGADTKTRPRVGEEEGVRQTFIKGREQRAEAEIGKELSEDVARRYREGIAEMSGGTQIEKEPVDEKALAEERKLRPVPMPEFRAPTKGQERAGEATSGFVQVGGRPGILRPSGAGGVSSLSVQQDYNVAQAGQGISGEFADENVRTAVRRAARGMGIPGDERGMVTLRHVGKAKDSNDLVDEDVTVNSDLARAYALQKAEHDALVASGKRDPRVNPMPHPERLYGGYYHGLVGVSRRFGTSPDVVESYAERIGGRSGRADVVAGLYGAGVQSEGSEKMAHHVDPSKATRLIDPLTGENHPISKLPELKHMVAEMQPHPKTGVMGFMRSKNKYQTYLTNPDTLEVKPGPQSFLGYNIENIGGQPTLIKREKPEHPYVQGLGDFLKTEMASTQPMGSKSIESRERAGRRAMGIAGQLQSGAQTGRAQTVSSAGVAEVEQTDATSTGMESGVTRRGTRKKASPTKSGTILYKPVQESVVTPLPGKKKSTPRQLQNLELDEAGNPKPYAPLVGVRGAEPFYSSRQSQTYNNPFAKTQEEANKGMSMGEIEAEAKRRETEGRFTGSTEVKKPKAPVYQGVLDFDQNLTDTETESRVEGERVVDTQTGKTISSQFNPVLGKNIFETVEPKVQKRSSVKPEVLAMAQSPAAAYNATTGNVPRFGTEVQRDVKTVTRPGTMWEEVRNTPEPEEAPKEPLSPPKEAYVKMQGKSGGAVELFASNIKTKSGRAKAAKKARENAPIDVSRGDYRENALPLGVAGPQGRIKRGTASGPSVQQELDFGTVSHEGGAQWTGLVQKGSAGLVEQVRAQDRNWKFASTQAGRTSSPMLKAGDFVHHKRFGGGKIVSVEQAEHPITKQPDLNVSVDFGGSTKGGMPNIKTLSMAEHGENMEKLTAE